MSDSTDDWPYSDLGSHPTPRLRIADILRDAGWDDDIRRMYGVDDDDDLDDLDFGYDRDFQDRCECKVLQLFSAADDLKEFLEVDVSKFPRNDAQVDSFAALGGWAHGSWSFYINVLSSVPFDGENLGSIHLFGCSKKGHSCRVVVNKDGEVFIKADKPELPSAPAFRGDDEDIDIEDDDLVDAREALDEELYDRRTFYELDEDNDDVEDNDDIDLIEIWREFMSPESEISTFLDAGLEPEEVIQLARLMPRSQVSLWVEEFGHESMIALEYLKIGLGELTVNEELEDLDLDSLRSGIASAIRQAISEEFEKTRNDRRVIEKKKSKEDESDDDEYFDLDDDPYWDDDL